MSRPPPSALRSSCSSSSISRSSGPASSTCCGSPTGRRKPATTNWTRRPSAPPASPRRSRSKPQEATMALDLPFIWAALIAFSVLAYVVLDGFDLGIGILFPLFPEKHDRDLMTNTIAPIWDGNETWLVLGGGGLLAVFPLAYATIFPALYMPLILMLLGLIFRGVAFEFRFRTTRWRGVWDWGFALGSTVAAAMQGIALGALVQGIPVADR